jgi:hypothetical protein
MLGWALAWRTGLVNAMVSVVVHGVIGFIRGGFVLDLVDRFLLFAVTTVAGLLITDWVSRRVARIRYQLAIEGFVGLAVMWRELVASLAWGSVVGAVAGCGFGLINAGASETMRARLFIGWIAMLSPVVTVMALGGVGWAAHRVFWIESHRLYSRLADSVGELKTEIADARTGEAQVAP